MGLFWRHSTANDDISLLHPVDSPHAKYAPAVKDSRGHFHDPDYRPFSPPPPHWHALSSASLPTDNADDNDDDNDDRRLSDGYAYSTVWAHRRVSHHHHRRDTSYYSPSALADYSPPTSYSSAATVLTQEPLHEKSWASVLKRRRKEKGEQQTCDEDPVSSFLPTLPQPKQEEYVPTCGEVFQRRWQTLCLAFNLSVFRAQRRVKHRVHSFMASHWTRLSHLLFYHIASSRDFSSPCLHVIQHQHLLFLSMQCPRLSKTSRYPFFSFSQCILHVLTVLPSRHLLSVFFSHSLLDVCGRALNSPGSTFFLVVAASRLPIIMHIATLYDAFTISCLSQTH